MNVNNLNIKSATRDWPDESPAELEELKKNGKATIHNAIWLAWVDLFKELSPQMLGDASR